MIGTATALMTIPTTQTLVTVLTMILVTNIFQSLQKGELSIKTKVNKKPGGNYLVKINALIHKITALAKCLR
ncbi:hypothetical protein BSPWISOXPB_5175 [uncultured Gammaproteobacteria bacterium]|nr:hypothetical protein BSPWISOXPB_5175 [uncultured Gammaproteobacteria bacterium]